MAKKAQTSPQSPQSLQVSSDGKTTTAGQDKAHQNARPIRLGDILKAEADPKSRDVVYADNVKIGEPVIYPKRGQFLIALSDSDKGKVLVQPHNCTINLDVIKQSTLDKHKLTKVALMATGDIYGIKYIGEPINDELEGSGQEPAPSGDKLSPQAQGSDKLSQDEPETLAMAEP